MIGLNLKNNMGLIIIFSSIKINNSESIKLLKSAIQIFSETLKIYKKKYFPNEFAETMMYLGIAYKEYGQLLSGKESVSSFLQALKSFSEANEIYNSGYRPMNWLEVQYNLSETHSLLGNNNESNKNN